MSFFDDSHVTEVGLQGSLGPSVGILDMIQQGFHQQFRVDSARALDVELQTRWSESLRALDAAGGGRFNQPMDVMLYRAMAEHSQGRPITLQTSRVEGSGYGARLVPGGNVQELPEFQEMLRANEAIRQLNNPEIKSFQQILEEVSAMQQEVEGRTASMSERSGALGIVGELIGAMGGSFTTRDPLNIITAPIGIGRTIATRIAAEMGIAAGTVGATEFLDVAPAREIAGLPERDPLFNIAAAALGAGVIRGGIEVVGAGVRRLREQPGFDDIDIDARDSMLAQMFADNADRPSARAAASILDDTIFIERNNPLGEGRAASERFVAELQGVQRAMNGAPMTAVARVLPPLPFEYIQKAADFEIVREQRPFVYSRMEQAQARVADLDRQIEEVVSREGIDLISAVRAIDESAATQLEQLSVRVNDETLPEAARVAADIEAQTILRRVGVERISKAADAADVRRKFEVRKLRASRRSANKEYRAAYRQVEAESVRLREAQVRAETVQQNESSNVLARASGRSPFVGPLLRYDEVGSLVDRINKINETLDEDTLARFGTETRGEGEDAVEVEVWERPDGIDIGLRDPVDPEFRIPMEDGEMTVAQIMRDLQDDTDLVEAIRTCAI